MVMSKAYLPGPQKANEAAPAASQAAAQAQGATSATGGWLGRFWGKQDGSISYLAVAGALVMMVFGGIGIDMIHAELKRTKLQNTLDRAVLAAANMDNAADPETTVEEYFRAMNLEDTLASVSVDQAVNFKRVSASAQAVMPSNFMQLIGVDTMQALGDATAEHGLNKIEVSLVLDVSGSMRGNKLVQLKEAANSFVDTLLEDDADGLVTISVVPYNATVNLGPDLAAQYNLENLHDFSHCAYFDAADFASAAIDPAQQLGQLGHFDPYSGGTHVTNPWCGQGHHHAIIAHSSDADAIKAHINSFSAQGNTAIDLGMKWGTALLDPSAQPVVAGMVAGGHIAPTAGPRPAAHNDTETMKFVVVMTDGANTTQYDLKDSRKYGMSEVWVDDRGTSSRDDDRYSIRITDNSGTHNDVYMWPHESYTSNRYRNGAYSALSGGAVVPNPQAAFGAPVVAAADNCGDTPGAADEVCLNNGPRQLSNAELFGRIKTRTLGNSWYYRAYRDRRVSYNTYRDAYYSYEAKVNSTRADSQLSTVCGAARDQGIVVYAIGVEAPQRGLTAMQDCASSQAHYFDVNGSELDDTFDAIARSLQQLRLTQ